MNRKSALILSGVLGTFFSTSAIAALNCTASPDCASLGYTMSAADCTDGVKVACPTDTSKVFCKTMPALSILYGDGTVDKNILSGKTPVGIVFDEKNKLAVALTDINESGSAGSSSMKWFYQYQGYDEPVLDNCEFNAGSTSVDTCGESGEENTYLLLRFYLAETHYSISRPAAFATFSYEPDGCSANFCKKKRWFLPNMGELEKIYANKSAIQKLLSQIGGNAESLAEEGSYWSSTEYNKSNAWTKDMSDGLREYQDKYAAKNYVRPVVYYGEPKILQPILYSDGTVSKKLETGKTPIGLVFDESKRLAVALTDVNSSGKPGTAGMAWGGDCDTPLLNCCTTYVGCITQDALTCDIDGSVNMTKLKDGCNGKANTAAMAAYNYAPTSCSKTFCQKNKWFLPSLHELNKMYSVIDNLNKTINLIDGAVTINRNQSYWSSNEYWSNYAWRFSLNNGDKGYYAKNSTYYYVRPVVKY